MKISTAIMDISVSGCGWRSAACGGGAEDDEERAKKNKERLDEKSGRKGKEEDKTEGDAIKRKRNWRNGNLLGIDASAIDPFTTDIGQKKTKNQQQNNHSTKQRHVLQLGVAVRHEFPLQLLPLA